MKITIQPTYQLELSAEDRKTLMDIMSFDVTIPAEISVDEADEARLEAFMSKLHAVLQG